MFVGSERGRTLNSRASTIAIRVPLSVPAVVGKCLSLPGPGHGFAEYFRFRHIQHTCKRARTSIRRDPRPPGWILVEITTRSQTYRVRVVAADAIVTYYYCRPRPPYTLTRVTLFRISVPPFAGAPLLARDKSLMEIEH